MAKKKAQGKTEIIRAHLQKFPDHTFKDAEAELAKHGITANYFSMVKSKMKPAKRTAKKKPSSAVDFARACGGIDKAIAQLEELKSLQV